jgi:hypothetical protein
MKVKERMKTLKKLPNLKTIADRKFKPKEIKEGE